MASTTDLSFGSVRFGSVRFGSVRFGSVSASALAYASCQKKAIKIQTQNK